MQGTDPQLALRLRVGQLAALLHEAGQGLDLWAVDAHPGARLQEHLGLPGGHSRHEQRQGDLLLAHVDAHGQGEPVGTVLVVAHAGGDDGGGVGLAVVGDVVVDLDVEGLQLAQDRKRLGHEAGRGHAAQVQGLPEGRVPAGQGQQVVEDLAGQARLPINVPASGSVFDATLGRRGQVGQGVTAPDLTVLPDVADEPLGAQVVLGGIDVDRERGAQRRGAGHADGGVGGQDRQRPGEGLKVLGLETLDVPGRDGDGLAVAPQHPGEGLGGARLERHEEQLAPGHRRVEAVDRVADRHEGEAQVQSGDLEAAQLLDVVDLEGGGDGDVAVALPGEVDAAAQPVGEVDGHAVALGGGEGQAGSHPAAQHVPDVGGCGRQGEAVVGVVEAVAAGHAGQLAQDAHDGGVDVVVQAPGDDLGPGGALPVPTAFALDERQHGQAGGGAPHVAGVVDDLQGHPTARGALHLQQVGQPALPGGGPAGGGRGVGLGLRQGARGDEQGGRVLAVAAHRARAGAGPGRRGAAGALLAEDHGLVGVRARALGLGADDVPVPGDADAPHPPFARVVQAALKGPVADPTDDLVISELHRPVVMPNRASHDPRLNAGYDSFGRRPAADRTLGANGAGLAPGHVGPGAGRGEGPAVARSDRRVGTSPVRRSRPGPGSRTPGGSHFDDGALYWIHERDADL